MRISDESLRSWKIGERKPGKPSPTFRPMATIRAPGGASTDSAGGFERDTLAPFPTPYGRFANRPSTLPTPGERSESS
jgi:hypothetical protein